MNNPQDFQQEFLRRLDDPFSLSRLFDFLPEVYFWAKNEQGQFIKVNRSMLAKWGCEREEEMVGKNDYDFAPHDLAEQYLEEDRRVMEGGVPIVNQAWLVPDYRGQLRWYLCSKTPLWGDGGKVIGSAGAMRDYRKAGDVLEPYQEMQQVVDRVLAHYAQRIEVQQLADILHLSVSQFDRKFKQVFQITPQQFILRVRVHAACQALTSTDQSIVQIAHRTGFYDHSYFTKQFRHAMGMTPTAYRKKYRRELGGAEGGMTNDE